MKFLHLWDRHYKFNIIREIDKAITECKKNKKFSIRFYGKDYYEKDKLWIKIKDQKWYETREMWAERLKRRGFETDGTEIEQGKNIGNRL